VVVAQSEGEELRIHCPNPGRLREILRPGRELLLERAPAGAARRTSWTLAAAVYRSRIIPLISSRANAVVGDLVLPRRYPGLDCVPEQTRGRSRFDWLVRRDDRPVWIEVKACTLVEHGRAMFPDAPSVRAVKHLEELGALPPDHLGEVIVVVFNPEARLFSPNPHTDPDFCRAFEFARQSGVRFRAVSVNADAEGFVRIVDEDLPIDSSTVELAAADRGIAISVLKRAGTERYTVAVEAVHADLAGFLRRTARRNEILEVLPVRGDPEVLKDASRRWFRDLEDSETDPRLESPFLEGLLTLRHREAFPGFTRTRPV